MSGSGKQNADILLIILMVAMVVFGYWASQDGLESYAPMPEITPAAGGTPVPMMTLSTPPPIREGIPTSRFVGVDIIAFPLETERDFAWAAKRREQGFAMLADYCNGIMRNHHCPIRTSFGGSHN